MVGCAPSQDSVAGFVSDLENIDGVTRVGVQSSERPADDATTGSSGTTATSASGSSASSDCRTRDFITKFELVVAFDAVPAPGTATSVPSVPSSVAPTGSQLASDSTGASSGGG